MGARSGADYLKGLKDHGAEVWLGNDRIRDVTSHPALERGARSVARLYDLQLDPVARDEMTFLSPSSGQRVGLSHIQPRTREDLERRSRMILRWARMSGGMLGRSPDYLNTNVAAAGAAAGFFAQNDPQFGENMRKLFRARSRKRSRSDAHAAQSAAEPGTGTGAGGGWRTYRRRK